MQYFKAFITVFLSVVHPLINAYILGVGVHPGYQNKGIGEEIIQLLVKKGKASDLNMQLFCKEDVKSYYEKQKFSCFAAGMVYRG
jgi:ribosomal protein S18 acetylase RimI-like enzyme